MRILTIDAETRDPNLKQYGMGSIFKIHYSEYDFKVLGFAYIDADGNQDYTSDWKHINELLKTHDALLMHNAHYDLGCLIVLDKYGFIDFKLGTHVIYDTMIMAKLQNQNYNSYALDYLAQALFGRQKKSDILNDFAWSTGMFADFKKELTGRNTHTRPSELVLERWCKSHMDMFPHEVMKEYALGDVELTLKLFERLYEKLTYLDLIRYSKLLQITLEMKIRGVNIDLTRAKEVRDEFRRIATDSAARIYDVLGEINIGSSIQLGEALRKAGYDVPWTIKGNLSVDAKWLDSQEGELIEDIKCYKLADKMRRDFIDKLIDYQEAIPEKYRNNNRGILYPSLKLLGATITGRFSSGGGSGSKEVSIHQIPARNPDFGAPCRSVFIPFEGEEWVCGDFSSQESRIQVHYATLLGLTGAKTVCDKWTDTPTMDYHQAVADITGLDRRSAKTINLGLSYGMGEKKLIASLKVNQEAGKEVLRKYHTMLPFMKQLQEYCSKALLSNKYIKTIDGRRLVLAKKMPDNPKPEKDGLSRLAQGSAAGQCMDAMIKAHEMGLKMTLIVHDELSISTSNPDRDIVLLRDAMENSTKMLLPSVSDIHVGNSWLEAK